jgi:NADH-quinone oxidoreductase subunit N
MDMPVHTMMAELWMPMGEDLRLFIPELVLVTTIVAVLGVALFAGQRGTVSAGLSLAGVVVAVVLNRLASGQVLDGGRSVMTPLDESALLICDNFAVFFRFFVLLFLAAVIGLWLAGRSTRTPEGEVSPYATPAGPEFFLLLLASALGMVLMVSTLHLLGILIAVELASLPSYAIVGSDKRSRVGAEASVKYALFGAASAGIMAYGISLLYGWSGTLDIPTMAAGMRTGELTLNAVAWIGLAATFAGIGFKIAAVPFHFWCPDVFEGAPIEVTTWLSVASKAAGLGLLLRLVYVLGQGLGVSGPTAPLAIAIGVLAAVTCTLGNLAALRQESVKRMLAYSSIAHAGYMMMAAAILGRAADEPWLNVGLMAVIAYLFVYLIMNLGAFGVTAMVVWQTGSDRLAAFAGLGRRAPWLALPMAFFMFSLVGLPPLGGFTAKWWLLIALGRSASQQAWLWVLVVVAVINTVISLYYYVRVIRWMYLTDGDESAEFSAPMGGVVLVNACAVALLLLGTVLFQPLGKRAGAYASNPYPTMLEAPAPNPVALESPLSEQALTDPRADAMGTSAR